MARTKNSPRVYGASSTVSTVVVDCKQCTVNDAALCCSVQVDVNGPNTAPVYQFLKSQKGGGLLGDDIKWNFGKFLVGKDGQVVQRYAPTTAPSAIEVSSALQHCTVCFSTVFHLTHSRTFAVPPLCKEQHLSATSLFSTLRLSSCSS